MLSYHNDSLHHKLDRGLNADLQWKPTLSIHTDTLLLKEWNINIMRTWTLTVTHGPNSFQPNAAQKNLVYGAGRPSGCVLSITSFTLHKKTTEISFQLALGNTIAVPSTHTKKKKIPRPLLVKISTLLIFHVCKTRAGKLSHDGDVKCR